MSFEPLRSPPAGRSVAGHEVRPFVKLRAVVAFAPSAMALESRARRINASFSKRLIDVVLSSTLIVLSSPLLLGITAAIKWTSPGPVLFRQLRYGCNGRPFWILKFRTMRVLESVGHFRQAQRDDARITPVGAFLRRTSLDELPQLFNVLAGSMSLIGPRPHAVAMDDEFARSLPVLRLRHLVRPGLTGLAQVNGYRGPTPTAEDMAERLEFDLLYIRTWSLSHDLVLLARTPLALLRSDAF